MMMMMKMKMIPKSDRISKLNLIKDEKIEKVIDILGVNRANIHFIENDDDDENENDDDEK